ncbi:MAG: cytochrome c biogenesis protein CcsA [Saprospiraceae bacterium]|nr:cytochrome c biogenesis protein CcsA [Saprospiraceae bacterium]
MKQYWWKALSIVLILYTIFLGLTTPLKPAIIDESQRSVRVAKVGDSLTLTATGYNTEFTKSKSINAWLTIVDSIIGKGGMPPVYPIKANKVSIIDDTHLDISVQIPQALPLSKNLQEANLVLETEAEGVLLRKSFIQIAQDSIHSDEGKALWSTEIAIEPRPKKFAFPNLEFTRETIRNTYFHVPMWFVMFTLYGLGLLYSIKFLRTKDLSNDLKAVSYTRVGSVFGFLGLLTGGMWANFAWGEPFPINEIKLLMVYTALAIYLAYFILRMSFDDFERRARISAVYSIFSFSSLVPLLYVIPKLAAVSSHPGNGGNSSIATQDMDNYMRLVFYPAIIGWILLGLWIASVAVRTEILKEKILSR